MTTVAAALLIGFVCGYGVRELISHLWRQNIGGDISSVLPIVLVGSGTGRKTLVVQGNV
jgi:hypothetical protein